MGHYASEMAGPPVRLSPDEQSTRRREAREHAAYRWDLFRRYEEQGEWIRSDDELVCPRCFAQVPALLRVDHDDATHDGPVD